jgi:tape measure domain-containing protein
VVTGIGVAALATGISYNQLQQTSRAALTTLTGSAEQANAQMDRLNEFASTSPFAKDVFIKAQQQMLGFGIEAQKVIPYLDSIQNAVAATGGSNQDIAELSNIFSKISASSKITAEDLNQFAVRGVDAATIIGSQMGMTGAQIREQITAGTLDAGQALDALAAGMQDRFGGAADNVKNTLSGAFDRVKAAWRDLSSELAAPLVGPEGGGLLVGLLNRTADLMRAFQALPTPIKTTIASLGGFVGVTATVAGGFLLLAPRIVSTVDAFRRLKSTSPGITSGLGRIASAAGKAGAMIATMQIIGSFLPERSSIQINEAADALRNLSAATAGNHSADLTGLREAFQGLTDPTLGQQIGNTASQIERLFGGMSNNQWNEQVFADLSAGLASIFESNPAEAAQIFNEMLEMTGGTAEELIALMPAYAEALRAAGEQAGVTGEDFDVVAWATSDMSEEMADAADEAAALAAEQEYLAGEQERLADVTRKTTDEMAEQVGQLETLLDVMRNAGGAFMDVQDAQAQYAETIMGLGDVMDEFATATGNALNEAGDNWDFYSEKGALANKTVNEIAQNGWDLVDSLAATGASADEMAAAMQQSREDVINQAIAFGMGDEAAANLADRMGLIPENVYSHIDVVTGPGLARLAALEEEMEQLPDGEVTVNGDTLPAEDALAEIVETINTTDADHIVINGNIVPIEEALDEIEGLIDEGVSDLDVGINRDGAILETTNLVSDIEGMAPEIPLLANDQPARDTLTLLGQDYENLGPTTNLYANDQPARDELNWFEDAVSGSRPSATIDADNRPALSETQWWKVETDKTIGTAGINARDRGAEDRRRAILRNIDMSTGTAGINAQDRGANSSANRILSGIASKTANVGVGAQARWAQINSIIAQIQNRAGSAGAAVSIGAINARAGGGPVWGPGTSTSDSIPTLLSDGEYVHRTAAAQHYGYSTMDAINQMRIPKDQMLALASGQHVARRAEGGPVGWAGAPAYQAPMSSSTTSTVNNTYYLQINPGDLQGIRTLEDLVANARRNSRQQVGVNA